jgi:hypothetical protein
MSFKNLGIMAMEEIEGEEQATGLEFVDAPEQDLAAADEAAGDVEEADAGIEAATDTAETLDGMAEKLEGSVEEGGMGEAEADAVEVAVEALCRRVGFPVSARKIHPAMESFEKAASAEQRIAATKIAIESIKEKAQAIWKRIVEAVKKAIAHVVSYYDKLRAGCSGLEKRALAVWKKGADIKGTLPADAKVKVSGAIAHEGSTGESIASDFKKHVDSAIIKTDRAGMLKKVVGNIDAVVGKDDAAATKAMGDLISSLAVGSASSNRSVPIKNGDSLLEEKLVFGGKSFYTQLEGSYKARSYVGASHGAKPGAGAEVAALQPAHAALLAEAVHNHMKATYTSLETSVRDAKSAAEAILKKVEAAAKEDGSDARHLATATQTAIQMTCVAGVQLRSYDVKVSNDVLNLAAKSLSLVSTKEAKADKAPAAAKA